MNVNNEGMFLSTNIFGAKPHVVVAGFAPKSCVIT